MNIKRNKTRNLTDAQKKQLLIARFGFKEDELEVMLKSNTVSELFDAASKPSDQSKFEDSLDIEPPAAELARVNALETNRKAHEQQKAQYAFPDTAQVTEEETQAARKSLDQILEEIEADDVATSEDSNAD